MNEENFFKKGAEIKASVPDDDMLGWIEALHTNGFSQKEIDDIMSHLNKEYRDQKYPVEDRIAEELKKLEEDLLKNHGKILSNEQREYLRNGIASREEFK